MLLLPSLFTQGYCSTSTSSYSLCTKTDLLATNVVYMMGDPDDLVTQQLRNAIVSGSKLIPYGGGLVSTVVGFLWPDQVADSQRMQEIEKIAKGAAREVLKEWEDGQRANLLDSIYEAAADYKAHPDDMSLLNILLSKCYDGTHCFYDEERPWERWRFIPFATIHIAALAAKALNFEKITGKKNDNPEYDFERWAKFSKKYISALPKIREYLMNQYLPDKIRLSGPHKHTATITVDRHLQRITWNDWTAKDDTLEKPEQDLWSDRDDFRHLGVRGSAGDQAKKWYDEHVAAYTRKIDAMMLPSQTWLDPMCTESGWKPVSIDDKLVLTYTIEGQETSVGKVFTYDINKVLSMDGTRLVWMENGPGVIGHVPEGYRVECVENGSVVTVVNHNFLNGPPGPLIQIQHLGRRLKCGGIQTGMVLMPEFE